MNDQRRVSSIQKMIDLGRDSCSRGGAQNNLQTYQVIEKGLGLLEAGQPVHHVQIPVCLELFRIMTDLHRRIAQSSEIRNSQVPNIGSATETFAELLLKSARQAARSNDEDLITHHCEVMLDISNTIQLDRELRRYGILDRRLKEAIGRLRKSAHIQSIFSDSEYEAFLRLTTRTGEILQQGDLVLTGRTLEALNQAGDKVQNRYIRRISFINYLRQYKNRYLAQIRAAADRLIKDLEGLSLLDIKEALPEIDRLMELSPYHQDTGTTFYLNQLKTSVLREKIEPLEALLADMAAYVFSSCPDPDWIQHEMLYEQLHRENEIFTEDFYETTLASLTPEQAKEILGEKIDLLRQIDLPNLRLIQYEETMLARLERLMKFFQTCLNATHV